MRGGFWGVIGAVAGLAAAATVSAQTVAPVKAPVVAAKPAQAAAVAPAAPSKLPPGPCASVEPLIAAGDLASTDFDRYRGARNYAAKLDYDRAVDRAPACGLAWLHRGAFHLDQMEFDKARADSDAALARLPKRSVSAAQAYVVRGEAEVGLAENTGAPGSKVDSEMAAVAIADLSQAMTLGLIDDHILAERWTIYSAIGDKVHAMADLDQAIALDPDNLDLIMERGDAHMQNGQYDAAAADFAMLRARARMDDPQRLFAYVSGALALERSGARDKAIALLSEALTEDPKSNILLGERAGIYMRSGDFDRAITDLSVIIAKGDNESFDAYIQRARAYTGKHDVPAAMADIDAALKLNPNEGMAYVLRGQIDEHQGDVAAAIADYDQGSKTFTSDGAILAANAACWIRATHNIELDKALAACNAALEHAPDYTAALDSRGFVHFRRGEYADAVTDYTAALKRSPKLASSLFGRALAEQKLGQADAAKADFAAARVAKPDIDAEFKAYGVMAE